MLSNLASYLGYAAGAAEAAETPSQAGQATDVRLRAVEDDDWVLVEVPPCPAPMQESWYLTPPPSFTSEGPVHMETSPLENLLIEHPSMSVYQHSHTQWRKPSRSSSEEDHLSAPVRPPRKEKPARSKLASRKTSTKRPPTSSSDDALSAHSGSENEKQEASQPRMKSFVKSPRRSINAELEAFSRKTSRRRAEASSSDEMVSIPSTHEDDEREALEEAPLVQKKKLYSEVCASKPAAKEAAPEPSEPSEPSEPVGSSSVHMAEEGESREVVERDRRPVQTIPDQQHRHQHFLNRSAQKTEQRKTCDLMKRNPLGRNNKARELNSRNKRQRRADMMQRHSGVNNNRKC